MWLYIWILAGLNTIFCRDVGKTLKTMPYVTNSLVNLGKMDISFHFNAHPQELGSSAEIVNQGSNSFLLPKKQSSVDEPCPCSILTYPKDSFRNHPSDILNRILSGNDLFSFKEPSPSPLCCDSHEHVQEDIVFEFSPKQNHVVANPQISNTFPLLPFLLDSFKNKPTMPSVGAAPKAVDIFFFPKKRGILAGDLNKFTVKKKDVYKKDAIKFVGDKEMGNGFKTIKYVPSIPSSVKKDLDFQDKDKAVTKKVEVVATTAVDKQLNTVV